MFGACIRHGANDAVAAESAGNLGCCDARHHREHELATQIRRHALEIAGPYRQHDNVGLSGQSRIVAGRADIRPCLEARDSGPTR
jgi:predicted acetyltransferase